MVGLSVSMCIKDILKGKVKEEDVEKIIGGTCMKNSFDEESVGEHYSKMYWSDEDGDSEKGLEIFHRLLASGKIEQPRLEGKPFPNIADGWWEESPDSEEDYQKWWDSL